MSADSHAGLVRMANDIARNLAAQGEATAVAATAEHIRLYWAPAMRAGLDPGDPGLSPIAARALVRLAG